MIKLIFKITLFTTLSISGISGQTNILIVTTDIGQDPDDQQSLVRLLHYANEFNLRGLIANADVNSDNEPPVLKDSIIDALIEEYAKIEDNLRLHANKYPTSEYLHSIVKKGRSGNGVNIPVEKYIGQGFDTEGSDWILKVVSESNAPVHIAVWGGACDLAQALWKARSTMAQEELDRFVKKLRVFFIGLQDSSNEWVIKEFPELWTILALDPNRDKWASGYRGMFIGGDIELTSKEWLHKFIIGQNPLADAYPDEAYTGGVNHNPHHAMKEGDSPSWLFFLNNGLNDGGHPSWGSWGGRYIQKGANFYIDSKDTYYNEHSDSVEISARATVYRWRPDFQNDFATRVQWGRQTFADANHPPIAAISNFATDGIVTTTIKRGENLELDATSSHDPDGDNISFRWYIYEEAGTYKNTDGFILGPTSQPKLQIHIPNTAQKNGQVHFILEVKDDNEMPLTSYKRIVVTVE